MASDDFKYNAQVIWTSAIIVIFEACQQQFFSLLYEKNGKTFFKSSVLCSVKEKKVRILFLPIILLTTKKMCHLIKMHDKASLTRV